MTSDTTGQPERLTDGEIDALERNIEPYEMQRASDDGRTVWTQTVHRCMPAHDARRLIADLRTARAELRRLTDALRQLVEDVDGGYDVLALDDIDRIRALIAASTEQEPRR